MRLFLIPLLLISTIFASDMQSLLGSIKSTAQIEEQEERARLKGFVEKKNEQQKLLIETKKELKELENRVAKLKREIESNDKTIVAKSEELHNKSGNVGEIFGVFKQSTAEFRSHLEESLTRIDSSEPLEMVAKLSRQKELPSRADLEEFWFLLTNELVASSEVVRFDRSVIEADGKNKSCQVVRIGSFSATCDGYFLKNSGEMLIKRAVKADANTIDPTRGSVLDLMVLKPSFAERMTQGGFIGYIILVLGVVGTLYGLFRAFVLFGAEKRLKAQLADMKNPTSDNPLGRIALEYNGTKESVEEQIAKEIVPLEKGQGLLKLLASVAPLLGLLGTVVGMISTFSAITLFGTSDPKLMAGGISLALVTTMQGLIVAVPMLFLHGWLSFKANYLLDIIEIQSLGLISDADRE